MLGFKAFRFQSLQLRGLRLGGFQGFAAKGIAAGASRNVGAFIIRIRIGFGGILYYVITIVRNPSHSSIGNYLGPYSMVIPVHHKPQTGENPATLY